jgi:hypothetical protein
MGDFKNKIFTAVFTLCKTLRGRHYDNKACALSFTLQPLIPAKPWPWSFTLHVKCSINGGRACCKGTNKCNINNIFGTCVILHIFDTQGL